MNLNLADKTVIVTGGSSNIGRAIVKAFAAENAKIVIADIDEVHGHKVAAEANSIGGRTIFFRTSVVDFESVSGMAKRTLEEFGRIDILVNNVGWSQKGLFIEKPISDWDKEIDLNLRSVLNCTKAVAELMVKQEYGKIINMSSDGGRIGGYGLSIYASSKAGVIAFTKVMARELGKYNVNVNVICPGFIPPQQPNDAGANSAWRGDVGSMFNPEMLKNEAKIIPLRRVGTPGDIANATIFFASDVSNYITGQTLSVDGGSVMM